jgi:hypothetical protein
MQNELQCCILDEVFEPAQVHNSIYNATWDQGSRNKILKRSFTNSNLIATLMPHPRSTRN